MFVCLFATACRGSALAAGAARWLSGPAIIHSGTRTRGHISCRSPWTEHRLCGFSHAPNNCTILQLSFPLNLGPSVTPVQPAVRTHAENRIHPRQDEAGHPQHSAISSLTSIKVRSSCGGVLRQYRYSCYILISSPDSRLATGGCISKYNVIRFS